MSLVKNSQQYKNSSLPSLGKKSDSFRKFEITEYGKNFAFAKPKLELQKRVVVKKSGRDSKLQVYQQRPQNFYHNQKAGRSSSLGQLDKNSLKRRNQNDSKAEKQLRQTKRFLSQQNISKKLKIPQNINDHFDSQDEQKDNEIQKQLLQAKHKIIPQQELYFKHRKTMFTIHHPLPSLASKKRNQLQKNNIAKQKKAFEESENQSEKQKLLPQSPSLQIYKHQHEQLVGEKAVSKYYQKYKNIDRIRDQQQFDGIENPMTVILTILQNYNIPPKKMQVIKIKGYSDILYLRNCGLGNGISIRAITQILARLDYFQSIDLSSNSIHADLVDVIIPNLKKMKRINLGNNRIGRRGCDQIVQMCSMQGCRLDELSLESNLLPDGAGVIILRAMSKISITLTSNPHVNQIKILNLSKNNLGINFALKMKEFLMYDDGLIELYLSWNQMTAKQCKLIFQGMTMNQSVKVLDMSWNNLGAESLKSMCQFVKKNKFLLHLDISFCEIDKKDTKVFAKALQSNHTIYGIHYQGNQGFIDHKGFIRLHQQSIIQVGEEAEQKTHKGIIDKKVSKPMPIPVRRGLIRRIDGLNRCKMENQYKQNIVKDICWICEGWQEKYFKVEKEDGDIMAFLHLEFQGFQSIPMNSQSVCFDVMRMCPPTNIRFFFSKVKKAKKAIYHTKSKFHALHQQKQANDNAQESIKIKPLLYLNSLKIAGRILKQVRVDQLNFQLHKYASQMFDQYYNCLLHCLPRSEQVKLVVNLGQQKKPKIKQQPKKAKRVIPSPKIELEDINRKNVIQQQIGNNQFIKRCADFDLENSKFKRICKDAQQRNNVRKILQDNYLIFSSVFYYLANSNPNFNGIFAISQSRFENFIEYQGYQTKRISKAKVRLKMISSLSAVEEQAMTGVLPSKTQLAFYSSVSQEKNNSNTKLFSRPQFFQFLLRLGIEKWTNVPLKAKQNKQSAQMVEEDMPQKDQFKALNVGQGFEKILKSLKRLYDQINPQKWRLQNMLTFQCNQVIQGYEIVLNKIYDAYAGSKQKNLGNRIRKKMLLDQFKEIFIDSKFKKTKEGLKQAEMCFLNAKKLQVEDGIQQFGLNYDQFCEAICRYAQIMNFAPVNQSKNVLFEKYENCLKIPLFLKIQSFIHAIYLNNKDLRSRKLDSYLKDGIFKQQIEALKQILEEENSEQQAKQQKQAVNAKLKLNVNTLGGEQLKQKGKRITLLTLVNHLNQKFEMLHRKQVQRSKRQKLSNHISQTQSEQEREPIQ